MTGSAKELFPNRRKAVFFVSFVLTFQALTVLAEDAMSLEDEYLLPVEKKNSLFDLYNSRQQLPNMASHDAFSSMTSNVNDNLPYDINMMDIDIANNRQERAVEGCGDGIDQCSDPLLNNCTGPFARCIDLDFGFECGCQEPYEWNTKAWTCVWKMYPFGNAASASAITGDDVTERLEVSAGIPFYRRKHTRIFIGSNGVVSFGRRYNPIVMEFPPDRRSVLCPYCADVDVSVTNTGSITYRLYDKNDANNDAQVGQVLQRASRDVETYTRAARFAASQVLIVTWYKVPKYGSDFPEIDYLTFQLVLVTDGETTYAMYIYNEMNWIPDWDPIVIGYGENWNSRTVSVSGTRGAYGRRNIGGSRGQSGFYIFRVGFVESYAQKCRNWFAGQVMEYYTNRFYYDDLPDCPCTVRRLRFDRRWRRIWGVTRNRLRCTTLNLNWNFYPMGKMCCYRNGIFVENGVNAGYAFRYHQWYSWAEHYVSDTLGKNYCCDRSNFCPLFHTIRPAGQCSRTSVFRQGGGFGDPHVATLDGKTFIFNGHGEYILINIAEVNMTFDLQARTGQAVTANGTATSATIFTAFAARENNQTKFHVELSPDKSKMYVFGNDETGAFKDYTTLFENNNPEDENSYITDPTLTTLTISKGTEGEIIVMFPSGNSFTVKKGPKLLTIDASIHTKYQTKTKGLLGNFDGNKDNDLIFPNGTTLKNDASEEEIFHYGQTWMLSPDKSVLRYPPRENADNYNFRNFTPMFLDQADPALRAEAVTVCGGEANIACVFDFVATGNQEVADATKVQNTETEATQAELANSVPGINANSSTQSVDVIQNANAVDFQVFGFDADNDPLTYQFLGEVPTSVTLTFDNNTGQGSIKATSTEAVSLRFAVIDNKGASSSIYQINTRVCDSCSGHGACLFNESRASVDTVETNDAFIIASCQCNRGWTGDNCSLDYDACEDKPCIPGQNCTDLTPDQETEANGGYNCSACPTGFEVRQGKCADINECNGTTHGCAQVCENAPGSYTCSCRSGYRKDEKMCHDIDECETGTHECEQTCTNTDGSYSCSCIFGSSLNVDNKTCTQTLSDCAVKTGGNNCSYSCSNETGSFVCICANGYDLKADNVSCQNIDECQQNICTQKCTDTEGSFTCSCFDGFQLADDKRSCQDCPELTYGANCASMCDCGDRASRCDSRSGCVCNDGWRGTKCDVNINECQENPNICGVGMLCEDTNGSYVCNCPTGYTKLENNTCADINECETDANKCVQICTNVPGSYSCSCRPGFKGDNCTDVDECAADQHDCEQLCVNVVGSYNCDCMFGYTLKADRRMCEKVKDVCQFYGNLNCSQGCSVKEDSEEAFCFCNTGYRLASDSQTCLDIDECTTTDEALKEKCSHTCINKDAGYDCSCPTGYKLENDHLTCKECDSSHWGDNCVNTCECGIGASGCDKTTGCVCKSGWRGVHCEEDIDECGGDVTCPANSNCVNSPGSYACKCSDGYRMNNASTSCDNIDECTEKSHNCDQKCEDKPGTFLCSCYQGFVWSEQNQRCQDIDECATQKDGCEHLCINTIGGYDCSCRPGFKLKNDDKKSCIVTTVCQTLTGCNTTYGGCQSDGTDEKCFCNKGYKLNADNKTCDDIQECTELRPCSDNGTCTELPGSYSCSCSDGFKLQSDQVTCLECAEGTYGTNCANNCTCSVTNTESCNKVSGTCTCKNGWNGTTCETDVDECKTVNCGNNSQCRNLNGSYACDCNVGYFRSANVCKVCDDKHWGLNCANSCTCTINSVNCSATDGACTCKDGWKGTDCGTDIDECKLNSAICSGIPDSVCKNTDGTYICDCKSGYKKTKNGTCQDINECLETTGICTSPMVCSNIIGSFRCSCAAGYSLNGNTCTDDNECQTGLHGCEQQCSNTPGSYQCYCSAGFVINSKDSTKCDEIKKFKAVVKLDYTLKDTNPNSAQYKEDVKMIKDTLTAFFRKVIIGFYAVIIHSLKPGSTVVAYSVIINSVEQKDPAGSLTKALLNISSEGKITGSTFTVLSQQIGNTNITSDTTPCSLLRDLGECPAEQSCEVVDGVPKCSVAKAQDNIDLIIGLSVGIPLFFILLAVIFVIIYMKLKSAKQYKAPSSSSSDGDLTYRDQPFRSVFASSLPRRSQLGQSNIGYKPDRASLDSWGNGMPYNGDHMDFHNSLWRDPTVAEGDNTPREFSWNFLKNVLPSEPFEIKRPKLLSSPILPPSPSMKRSTRYGNEHL